MSNHNGNGKIINVFVLKGGKMPFRTSEGDISYPAHVGAVLNRTNLGVEWDMLSPPPKSLRDMVVTEKSITPAETKYALQLLPGEDVLLGLRVVFGDWAGNWYATIHPREESILKGLSSSTLRKRRDPLSRGKRILINLFQNTLIKPHSRQEPRIFISNSGGEPVLIRHGWSPVEFVFHQGDSSQHTVFTETFFKPRLVQVQSIQELCSNGNDIPVTEHPMHYHGHD